MVYDSVRRKTVLFGGYNAGALQDTWEWDGTRWTELFPANRPPALYVHVFAFDAARGRAVLFGGYNSGGYRAETWEWDGSNWFNRTGGASPSARGSAAAAYDAVHERVVLFGGGVSATNFADTWEWDGSTWRQRSPAVTPPARQQHAMAFDGSRGRVVIFAGGNTRLLTDTWEWDGDQWLPHQSTAAPMARRYHAMTYDAARGRTVLFGGDIADGGTHNSSSVYFNDTWEYYHPDPATFTTFGNGCPSSTGVPVLAIEPGDLPWIGATVRLRLGNLPAGCVFCAPFMIVGVTRSPLNLAGLGRPDCDLLVSLNYIQPLVIQGSTATFTASIPNNVGLIGASLHVQGGLLQPSDIAVSNGGTLYFQAR